MKIFRDIISSRNNTIVKWAASLADKKGRNESCSFIVEGEKLCVEALRRGLPVTHVFVLEGKDGGAAATGGIRRDRRLFLL